MAGKTKKRDVNQSAADLVAGVTGFEPPRGVYEALLKRQAAKRAAEEKNPAAVALGRLGGLKGGKARAEALSPKKRSQIAAKAAKQRWEIVKLVQKGYTSREIEKSLGITLPRERYEALRARFEEMVRQRKGAVTTH